MMHSDEIDVSLSIREFSVIAGTIDRHGLKHIKRVLFPKQPELMRMWKELEIGNGVAAEQIIGSLEFQSPPVICGP